jgi:PelA/Pel-15E family pectate lyase
MWPLAAATMARNYLKQPEDWYSGPEARRVATNILSWQSELGGWPKNTNTTDEPFMGKTRQELKPTFDNKATTDELRFLARYCNATKDTTCRSAFERGYDYILKAQYPTGGWPQFYPPGKQYHRHITFNDNAMVRLMDFLRETCASPVYGFLDQDRKAKAKQAFDLGVHCILKCQIKVDGKLTGWCAQHDELDYSPRPGRVFELKSLSGAESVGIVRLLMSLDQQTPEIVDAVQSAVAWFEAAKLNGIKVTLVPDPQAKDGNDRRVVTDPAAPPMWARFYEIGSNQPIFCDRDGIAKPKLSDIGYERRNGYSWLGYWPADLLEKDYPAWKQRFKP